MTSDEKTSVRVAVRVRPLSVRERGDFQTACLQVAAAEPQIIIGTERAFTFDFTFKSESQQETVYKETTEDLVEGCFNGYNATVLAYGQTGSGKTYTMGTGFDVSIPSDSLGIIPRAVEHIFDLIRISEEERIGRPAPTYDLWVQFIELYQDELVDLLDRASRPKHPGAKRVKPPRLGEDKQGNVQLFNVRTMAVTAKDEIMDWLKQGALARTTGSTNMNAQSSRSHAIFTIGIKKSVQQEPDEEGAAPQYVTTSAKLHFVDLAGSERLKRTLATGDRAKESIAINGGLLALGNVISKLGDKSLKATHIPYRSSKLTRLLQDSLGGNSRTLMIACVSPAEQDFVETLNTLRYANRTRNIQNKISVNQDKTGETIANLRARAQELEMKLLEFQQGKRLPGVDAYNDMFVENNMLQKENETMKIKLKIAQDDLSETKSRNAELRAENDRLRESMGCGSGDGADTDTRQNMTDVEKIRSHYCCKLEEVESNLRKTTEELERVQSLRSPFSSPHKSPGNNTYRIKREKKQASPCSAGKSQPSSSVSDNGEVKMDEDLDVANDTFDEDNEADVAEAELSDLEHQILEKEKSLEEIEQLKHTLQTQREDYEAKMEQLNSRIKDVELERNSYLNESRSKKGEDREKVRERELKYQEELEDLKKQLKEQLALQKKVKALQKENTAKASQVAKMKDEITHLKKIRCETLKKVDLDSKRSRQKELEQTRAISRKEKEYRSVKKENTDLKTSLVQSQLIISRLRAEVQLARSTPRNGMSDLVAGRVGKLAGSSESLLKKNWDEFVKHFHAVSYKRMRLKAFEKQLSSYGEDLKELRQQAMDVEKKLSVCVEKERLPSSVDNLKRQLADTKTAIHFIEQQNSEIQNEAASCEETVEELNHMDPVFLRSKFVDESSTRFFLERVLELSLNQNEEVRVLENHANAKATELNTLIKERNMLRELLQYYVAENPDQTKVDIAGVAKQRSEENGWSDDMLRNMFATPIKKQAPQPKIATRTKARAGYNLNGQQEMLIAGTCDSSVTSSSSASNGSLSSHSDKDDAMTGGVFRVPTLPLRQVRKDLQKIRSDRAGTSNVSKMVVNGTAIAASPLRAPNRSISMTEISGDLHCHRDRATPSSGHSLENVTPIPVTPTLTRRHCTSKLDLIQNSSKGQSRSPASVGGSRK